MEKRIEKKMNKQEEWIQEVEVSVVGEYLQAKCLITSKDNKEECSYAFYVYKTGITEAIHKSKYTKMDTHQVLLTEGGEYCVKVLVKKNRSGEVKTKMSNPIRKKMKADIKYQNNLIHLAFETPKNSLHQYEYAYYLYQDGSIIDRCWYQRSQGEMTIEVRPIYSGTYQIRLFIRKDGEIVLNQLSNRLPIDLNTDTVIETRLENEKVFFSDIPVNYWFRSAKKNSKYLVISFSGLNSTEFQGKPPVYNHMRTLSPIDCHQLFILDSYKGQFCYYIGFGGTYDYERSVVALITTIANTYRIAPKNIIVVGSSKGGAAALYYSLKYQFGKAVIGAPQTYIANYLERRATSDSMKCRFQRFLGVDKKYGMDFWNHLILHQVSLTSQFPELYFHVGKDDFHYPEHLSPLLQHLDSKGVGYELDLADYANHNDMGIYFTPYLLEKVRLITSRKEVEN